MGTLRISVSVNGEIVHQGLWSATGEGTLTLSADRFSRTQNDVVVDFTLQRSQDPAPRRIARAEYALDRAMPGDRVALSGLVYRYDDADGDSRFDVHELAVRPDDIDGDGLSNADDADSDNDGLADGVDVTPYGEGRPAAADTVGEPITLRLDDGTEATLTIDALQGDRSELVHLVDTMGTIALHAPPGWPTPLPVLQPTGWTAFTLQGRTGGRCPNWRIAVDASALRSTLSRTALLYFRRPGEVAHLAPLGAESIADLGAYGEVAAAGGDRYDDALRIVLVPASSVGWLELSTQRDFGGERCAINLATPSRFSVQGPARTP